MHSSFSTLTTGATWPTGISQVRPSETSEHTGLKLRPEKAAVCATWTCEAGPIFTNVEQKVGFIHPDEFGLIIKFFVLIKIYIFLTLINYHFIVHILLRPHLTPC